MASQVDEYFMGMAIRQAELAARFGEVPVGAVLVKNGLVIGSGHNMPISQNDPSSHAEMMAIRNAGRVMNNYRLPETTLYVTLEPCMMCSGAIMNARISRLVYGAADLKTGCVHSVLSLFDEKKLNHHTECVGGVLSDSCANLLKNFFKDRR